MSFSDQLGNLSASMKSSAQNTSMNVATLVLRILTGLILGYVLGLIFQELLQSGNLVVVAFVIVMSFAFMKISKGWSFTKVLIFDIFIALVLQILKMYILLAP